jgi:broad specificity phosphatase PhoE
VPAESPLILLCRHGRTELNSASAPRLRAWENPPLDKRGILDAKLAASNLKRYKPQMIYCSDLMRDTETANIIANELGNLPFDIDFGLRTADMGELGGMLDAEAAPLVAKWYAEPWWSAPGGESNNNFLRRWYPAFDLKFNLARDVEAFRPSIIVTHGRPIAAIHARSAMIPQGDALMPYPGGIASVYLDERGEMKLDFITETEPVSKDQ